jgi:hypothetical protein
LILFLVQVPSQEVSHTALHYSFLDFWEIIGIKFEIFDKLCGLFAIDVGAKGFDELFL